MRIACRLGLLAFVLAPALAWSQGAVVETDEVRAELVAHAPEGVGPDRTAWLGLLIRHAPHWHTYWRNPGDSGLPTTFDWLLPAGVSAGPIEWPTPQRLPVGPLVNYGYEGTVLLPVPLDVARGFAAPALDVRLRADWLVCKELCIPQFGEFALKLPAGRPSVAHAREFAEALDARPRELPLVSARAEVRANALHLRVGGLPTALHGRVLDFYAANAGVIEHAAVPAQRWHDGRLELAVPLSAQRSDSPATMQAVIAAPGSRAGIALSFAVDGWPAAASPVAVPAQATGTGPAARSAPPAATPPGGSSIAPDASPAAAARAPPADDAVRGASAAQPDAALPAVVLLGFAFAGGLLLNLMPCVFPVLSLKVLGFVGHAADRRRLAAGGLAYTAGVLSSFVALAGLLLALRAAGDPVGWGFQLQSPVVVAALALLFALIGLNLLGVYEVGRVLPSGLAAARARHPLVDHALTGVLAVAVASPCTAPFMGAALGAAFTQPAPLAVAIFASLGLGMASPYLAASLWPGFARLLPRPGAWMVQVRTLLAFPMLAAVVWLLWVLGQQAGIDAVAGLLGVMVALAFACWTYGSQSLARRARTALGATATVTLAATVVWAWPMLQPLPVDRHAAADAWPRAGDASDGWQPWSEDAVAQARAAGRPVFVDFTAAWCVTCLYNKRTVLGDEALLAELRERRVLLLRADWTRRDAAITQQLQRLGRSGVPVYALYAPGAAQPQLLSEILTVGEIRAAIARWPAGPGPAGTALPSPRVSS